MTRLTEQQTAELGQRLDARAAELGAEVRALSQESNDPPAPVARSTTATTSDPADLGERGEQAIRTAVRHAEMERDQQELQQIAAARERMRTGDYGQCIDCGADIAPARLQALPSAERCVPCQERHERDHPVGVRISLTS